MHRRIIDMQMNYKTDSDKGKIFPVNYDLGADARHAAMLAAIDDAKNTLSKGDVFEVRAKYSPHDSNDPEQCHSRKQMRVNNWGVAWFYSDEIPQSPLFEVDVDKGKSFDSNCLLVARLKVS